MGREDPTTQRVHKSEGPKTARYIPFPVDYDPDPIHERAEILCAETSIPQARTLIRAIVTDSDELLSR